MLRHANVWQAIDRLAHAYGLSPSGLARRAGLDPTTFNKSKRVTREGKLRWPSTESIAKVLGATGASLAEFVSYLDETAGAGVFRTLPMIGFAQAAAPGYFDDTGNPSGSGWDEIPFPELSDPRAYALEIGGNGLVPTYRDGDIVVVSPQTGIRRGDRVVVKTRSGEIMARQLRRRSARKIELQALDPRQDDRVLNVDDILWMARIVWASQ